MRRPLFVPLLSGVAALVCAQSSVPSIPRVHAIVDARVEVGDGRVLERATVVIRDGLIVAVGQDAEIPKGARVFSAKGMVVYPGFIDAFTTKGVTVPTIPDKQDDASSKSEYANAMMREANRKQVHPEVEARRCLTLTDDVRSPYLKNGFTTLMVVPAGEGLRGQGTLVNLSGRAARESVVVPVTGQAVSWNDSGSSDYPAALLGSVAQFRQAMADALWQRQVIAGGVGRPYSDPVLESLSASLNSGKPFFVQADTFAQIERANRMQKEWGFPMVMVGALEGWKNLKRLPADAPLILSLSDLLEPKAIEVKKPEEAKSADQKPTDDKKPKEEEKKPADADEPGPDPEEPAINAERIRIFKEAMSNAGVLSKAGYRFGLATCGNKDAAFLLKQLRIAVKQGLPKEVALRALTIDAAKILGVDRQLGTIEVGKAANLNVMSLDFLNEKSTAKMLYIDGYRVDPNARPASADRPRRRNEDEL